MRTMNLNVFLLQCFMLFATITTTQSEKRSLNKNWKLINRSKNILIDDIQVPSGVYSDLENAGLTQSVLVNYNDVKLRWISKENWTYSTEFDVDDEITHNNVILTFHGVDTFSSIYLNNVLLGVTDNMFLTYSFEVRDKLKKGTNMLRLEFLSPVSTAAKKYKELGVFVPPECPPTEYNGECHMNTIRKMQASFSWDWGLAAPSVGIFRDVELEFYDSAEITDVIVNTILTKDEKSQETWELHVRTHLTGNLGSQIAGTVSIQILELPEIQTTLNRLIQGETVVDSVTKIDLNKIEKWWPNEYGEQKLYNLRVKWEDASKNDVKKRKGKFLDSEKVLKIGFRTVELVQDRMDNGLSFYFKINGIPIFMKGSNWIPSHILPELSADKERVTFLLQAAKDSHMNMLRVWGGGLYESDLFYQIADEMGILLWHDMMFACAMYRDDQEFLDSVRLETNQNVKRLQHHPSIALWATNNENEVALRQNWYKTSSNFTAFAEAYRRLYVETIEDEIRKIDPLRPLLTSSPSNGAKEPEDNGIALNPQDTHYGDIHYYNYIANDWDSNLYGNPRFASEYGFQSYPSIKSWLTVIGENNFEQFLKHRQHSPLGNAPIEFLVKENIGVIGETWDEKIYLSQVSQAMAIKAETEVYRAGRDTIFNTMGALYWQLNDVWVAPSWSSIEYTGHYKILYHFMKKVFEKETFIAMFNKVHQIVLFGVSDNIEKTLKTFNVTMKLFKYSSLVPEGQQMSWNFIMQPNTVSIIGRFDIYRHMAANELDVNEYVAMFQMFGGEGEVARQFIFPSLLRFAKGVKDPNIRLSLEAHSCQDKLSEVEITVSVEAPALFVHLELLNTEVEQYQLSDNGFMQFEPTRSIKITYRNPKCLIRIVPTDFKVMDVNRFLLDDEN